MEKKINKKFRNKNKLVYAIFWRVFSFKSFWATEKALLI